MAYDDLLSIYKEAAIEHQVRRDQVPQACPNDGTALDAGPNGTLHCPYDGWQWPRDRATAIT